MKRVLVVDDDDDLREILGELLAHGGYDVALAASGNEALAWLRSHGPPDLLLLDLMMPDMSGPEVKASIDRDPSVAAAPVLVISGDTHVAEQAAAMGASGWIGKPVELASLFAAIARHVR